MKALGAEVKIEHGDVIGNASNSKLIGNEIYLGGPNGSTVLGTANVLCARRWPRHDSHRGRRLRAGVVALANMLAQMGAKISGISARSG